MIKTKSTHSSSRFPHGAIWPLVTLEPVTTAAHRKHKNRGGAGPTQVEEIRAIWQVRSKVNTEGDKTGQEVNWRTKQGGSVIPRAWQFQKEPSINMRRIIWENMSNQTTTDTCTQSSIWITAITSYKFPKKITFYTKLNVEFCRSNIKALIRKSVN